MILKVRKQIFITYSPGTQYYISNGKDRYLTKDGVISKFAINGWWHSKVEAETFLTGWKVLNPPPAPKLYQIDFEPRFELGTRHIQYVDGIRVVHRYCKVDGGKLGTCSVRGQIETLYRVDYRWIQP